MQPWERLSKSRPSPKMKPSPPKPSNKSWVELTTTALVSFPFRNFRSHAGTDPALTALSGGQIELVQG
jgi:hypothetical protein